MSDVTVYPDRDSIKIAAYDQSMGAAIQFTKTQQWMTAYYGLLLQGAVIGAFELLWNSVDCTSPLKWTKILFALIAIIATIFVAYYGNKMFGVYKKDLSRYQGIVDKFTSRDVGYLSETVKKLIKDYPELEEEFYTRSDVTKRQSSFIVTMLRWVFVIGIFFSLLYFCFKVLIYFQKMEGFKMSLTNFQLISILVAIVFVIIGSVSAIALIKNCYDLKLKRFDFARECCKIVLNKKKSEQQSDLSDDITINVIEEKKEIKCNITGYDLTPDNKKINAQIKIDIHKK